MGRTPENAEPTGRRTPGVVPLLAACALAALLSSARAQQQSFDAWLQDFRSEALAARISSATLDAALAGLAPLEPVIARDREQPEFTLDFRSYLTRVASQSRIEEGQRMLAEHGELVRAVGSRYGMPPSLLVAVWGIESNYGRTQGEFPVVQALATLAYDGRRGAMFRRELLNALRILDQGHVELDAMRGSWAGAMGQLQFMPSTFIDYAKDGDGDGRKNIWGSAADALESAASFMSSGWRAGTRWGRQVRCRIVSIGRSLVWRRPARLRNGRHSASGCRAVRRCRAKTCGPRSSSPRTAPVSRRSSCTRTTVRSCAGIDPISSRSPSAISPTGLTAVPRSRHPSPTSDRLSRSHR